jgi:hypothetical protein
VAALNVSRSGGAAFGGGKKIRAEVQGLKELERKVKALAADNPQMLADLAGVVNAAGADLRDDMRSRARGAGWASQSTAMKKKKITGQDAIDSIFSSAKVRTNSRSRVSTLVGVGKWRTMVTWIAGRYPKADPSKVKRRPGEPVAMAFATMLEFGTSNRPARPAIRAAVTAGRTGMLAALADGFNGLLQKYSK